MSSSSTSKRSSHEEDGPAVKRHRKSASSSRKPTKEELELHRRFEEEDKAEEEERRQRLQEAQQRQEGNVRSTVEDSRSRHCPYLDTINRHLLDFDFEKLCSISLSHLNVYACLVCGKYFQGRGTTTHAHTHSVNEGHHVYLNLETYKFYCLPDNYEIIDSSLEDITYLLNPTFSRKQIGEVDRAAKMVRAYDGNTYYPGIVGLNNIKANDYCNVVLQLLCHIPTLRNFFLDADNYKSVKRHHGDLMNVLVQRFGELSRKLWNPRNFKTHVSPHEFLQAVVLCSKKRFLFTRQGDAVEFLSWVMNALHLSLRSGIGANSIISRTFRGRMLIYSKKVIPVDLPAEERERLEQIPEYMEQVAESKFMYLTCDLPPAPLYVDEMKENIIPQVPMATIMAKFSGANWKEYKTHKDSILKRFVVTRLPPFLVLYVKRFLKNIFTLEKNPTIVNFPIRSLDMGDLLEPSTRALHKFTTYDLVGNMVHDGGPEPGEGTYRVHMLHRGTGKWFEMQDLHVQEVLPQMIPLSETLVQVWQVNKSVPNPFYKPPDTSSADNNGEEPSQTSGDLNMDT